MPEPNSSPATQTLETTPTGQVRDLFLLLAKKERAATRDGKPYYRVHFEDGTGSVVVMVWADSEWFADCEQEWQPGAAYKIRGVIEETSFGPQLSIVRIRLVCEDDRHDGFNPDLLKPSVSDEIEALAIELHDLIAAEVPHPLVQQVLSDILTGHAEQVRTLPGSVRHHHREPGGWLVHTASTLKIAIFLCDHYQVLDDERSLVLAGVILHDIGKLTELALQGRSADYTPAGRLLGHVMLGRDILRAAAEKTPEFPPELLLRLEHVIASHPDRLDHGAAVRCQTREAMLVFLIDQLDTRFAMVTDAIENAGIDSGFTGKDNPLRREFFLGLEGRSESSANADAE